MNTDMIKGQSKQVSTQARTKWNKLTEEDLKVENGSAEYLAGKVQERYGVSREEASRQVKAFAEDLH